ncbi:MAG: HNH endonuclease [Bacteroidales bacterium]|jgi:hypothetical protein|nr:HNH endonuclease [Bacteroidales bacterium]
MIQIEIDQDFSREVECVYKEERYSVRDNGAVLRHCRDGKRLRKDDNQWTFGKPNEKTGYMEIATERVHRIVATAFLGDPPTKEHVVDHIDTNKKNNRPENLRWVTRLENALLNPITVRRIELVCGSVEAFLENPAQFRDKFQEPNYEWMCTVSKEESQRTLERLTAWAKSGKQSQGGSLGKWIIECPMTAEKMVKISDVTISLTPFAVQRDWQTPTEFPCTPQKIGENPLAAYSDNIKEGQVFCCNQYDTSIVFRSAFSKDGQSIYVMTEFSRGEEAVKPYALAKITYENGLFVHTGRTFFSKEGAEKQFTLVQGLEWTGGDSIDDYC